MVTDAVVDVDVVKGGSDVGVVKLNSLVLVTTFAGCELERVMIIVVEAVGEDETIVVWLPLLLFGLSTILAGGGVVVLLLSLNGLSTPACWKI